MSFADLCKQAQADQDPTINDKVASRALLKSWGFETADLIAYVPDPIMLEPYLTQPVVVKPRNGSTSHGVHALTPTGEGWHDRITGETYTLESLAADINHWNARFDWPPGAIAETPHLHGDDLAYEYKVYSFQGPKLIQGRHYRKRYAWWHNGERVETGKLTDHLDPHFPPPPEGLAKLADAVHAHFPWVPFLRVDCFYTDDGWKVGEVADHVGGRWFNREWDKRLGRWWQASL